LVLPPCRLSLPCRLTALRHTPLLLQVITKWSDASKKPLFDLLGLQRSDWPRRLDGTMTIPGGFTDIEVDISVARDSIPFPKVDVIQPDENGLIPHTTNNLITTKLKGDRCMVAVYNFNTGLTLGASHLKIPSDFREHEGLTVGNLNDIIKFAAAPARYFEYRTVDELELHWALRHVYPSVVAGAKLFDQLEELRHNLPSLSDDLKLEAFLRLPRDTFAAYTLLQLPSGPAFHYIGLCARKGARPNRTYSITLLPQAPPSQCAGIVFYGGGRSRERYAAGTILMDEGDYNDMRKLKTYLTKKLHLTKIIYVARLWSLAKHAGATSHAAHDVPVVKKRRRQRKGKGKGRVEARRKGNEEECGEESEDDE
jgi:hypothetical protein